MMKCEKCKCHDVKNKTLSQTFRPDWCCKRMKLRCSLGKTKVLGQMLKSCATLEPVLVYRSMHLFKQSFRVRCLLSRKWFTFCQT